MIVEDESALAPGKDRQPIQQRIPLAVLDKNKIGCRKELECSIIGMARVHLSSVWAKIGRKSVVRLKKNPNVRAPVQEEGDSLGYLVADRITIRSAAAKKGHSHEIGRPGGSILDRNPASKHNE
jgi:hypothetical protein